jgi:hypothetical protein
LSSNERKNETKINTKLVIILNGAHTKRMRKKSKLSTLLDDKRQRVKRNSQRGGHWKNLGEKKNKDFKRQSEEGRKESFLCRLCFLTHSIRTHLKMNLIMNRAFVDFADNKL